MFGIEHDKTWVLRSKSEIVSTTEQSALTETILDIAEQVATQRSLGSFLAQIDFFIPDVMNKRIQVLHFATFD